MPAIKVSSKVNAPSLINLEIEKNKARIKTIASAALEGPGQEHFMDVYFLEMVRLQEAFMDEDDIAS